MFVFLNNWFSCSCYGNWVKGNKCCMSVSKDNILTSVYLCSLLSHELCRISC
jgi:hypothetical protein